MPLNTPAPQQARRCRIASQLLTSAPYIYDAKARETRIIRPSSSGAFALAAGRGPLAADYRTSWLPPPPALTCPSPPHPSTLPVLAPSGYVAWVTAAFGPFWGFQEGLWSWLSGVADNSLYPVMLAANLKIFFPELESGWPRMWVNKGPGAGGWVGVVRGTFGNIAVLYCGRVGARGRRSWSTATRACG